MLNETYFRGASFLHRADPRVKLFYLLFFSSLFFFPLGALKYSVILVIVFAAGLSSLPFKEILKPVKIIMPLLALIVLLTPPFNTGGEVYFALSGRPLITSDGLSESLHLASRFLGLTMVFFLFLRTTRIEDFILSLRYFRLSYRLALIISLTVRYLPYIASIYENTLDAHRMRLTAATPAVSVWNFPARFRKLLSVLTSVLIQAVKSIPGLAMALETRGVGRKNNPGQMKRMKALKELRCEIILLFFVIFIMLSYISL